MRRRDHGKAEGDRIRPCCARPDERHERRCEEREHDSDVRSAVVPEDREDIPDAEQRRGPSSTGRDCGSTSRRIGEGNRAGRDRGRGEAQRRAGRELRDRGLVAKGHDEEEQRRPRWPPTQAAIARAISGPSSAASRASSANGDAVAATRASSTNAGTPCATIAVCRRFCGNVLAGARMVLLTSSASRRSQSASAPAAASQTGRGARRASIATVAKIHPSGLISVVTASVRIAAAPWLARAASKALEPECG